MDDPRTYFAETVWPQVPAELKAQFAARYPRVRLSAAAGFVPLPQVAVCMVVGLTGTGKSTALARLDAQRSAGSTLFEDDIPDRRTLADLAIIPTAQALAGEPVQPVKDREQRFALTRRFAQSVDAGGSAAVYGWLYYQWDGRTPLLSDGLRGPGEIAYALAHYPRWRVCELWVDPLIRLRRLSQRGDRFDVVGRAPTGEDVAFLPADRQAEALKLLAAGEISADALVTARAEAQNYGGDPYDRDNHTPRYRCLRIDDQTPEETARQIAAFMGEAD
jgi:hypothetical protein